MKYKIDLPEDPTISQIKEAIREHYAVHPTHGINCFCMDSIIRILRYESGYEDHKAVVAYNYVLSVASREYI